MPGMRNGLIFALLCICAAGSFADAYQAVARGGRFLGKLAISVPEQPPAPQDAQAEANYHSLPVLSQPVTKPTQPHPGQPRLAIIIDDIGNSIDLGKRTVALPGKLTLAILPKTPGANLLAEEGYAAGKQIMLHAPMSNYHERALGPGGLTETMDKGTFITTLNADIDAIPHISGVNNHMGSLLTAQQQQMQWVMETLQQRHLFFIDSLTNSQSVAYRTAREYGLQTDKRDVFLDHFRDEAAIEKAYRSAIRIAKLYGSSIAIGHPYPETLAVLERLLPELTAENIELVHVSEILHLDKNQQVTKNTEQITQN